MKRLRPTTATPPPARHAWTAAACLAFAAAAVGCWSSGVDDRALRRRSLEQRRASTSSTLLESVTSQLRDLPSRVPLNLKAPVVVLDSTSSANRGDVTATLGPTPGSESEAANFLTVTGGNADFRGLGIEPGDTVKCFLLPDTATLQRLRETGELDYNTLTHDPVELTVTQVTGANTLRVADQLRIPVRAARELGRNIDPQILADAGLPEDFVSSMVTAMQRQGLSTADGLALPAGLVQALPGVAWPFRIEVWRVDDERMVAVNNSLVRYITRAEPRVGWEPSPDAGALAQIVEQINQWLRSRQKPADWAPASLASAAAADAPPRSAISAAGLGAPQFSPDEGRLIQEASFSVTFRTAQSKSCVACSSGSSPDDAHDPTSRSHNAS
ncbi:MAG: hypothetical protein AAF790_11700 [Planctomycetota bacterium]